MWSALRIGGTDKAYQDICTGNKQRCPVMNPLPNCPQEKELGLEFAESSLEAALDIVCENQGELLKQLLDSLQCWNLEAFNGCLQRLLAPMLGLDFSSTQQAQENLQVLRRGFSQCVRDSMIKTGKCEQIGMKPVERLLDIFMERTAPGYKGDAPKLAASCTAALLSVVLALVFTRRS